MVKGKITKKIIASALAFCIIFSTMGTANAQANSDNSLPSNITIVEKEDVLSPKMIKELAEEEKELAKKGIYKTSEIYYVENDDLKNNDSVMFFSSNKASASASSIAACAHSLRTYSSEAKELSKSSNGMSYWIDVAWNLTIGSKTKYIWKAATVLGINPSNLASKRMKGDSLKCTYQYAYHDYIYYGKNTRDKQNYQCMKTTRLELTTYIDLYTFTKSGQAYRKSSKVASTYKTQHYGDTTFIAKQCKENAMYSGISVYQDTFK